MTIYGLISWDYKPSRTYLCQVATSKKPLLETVRESYRDRLYDDLHDEGLSDAEIDAIAANMSYDDLEDWMYEHTNYVIDSCAGLDDLN